jgi:hypothetical protein
VWDGSALAGDDADDRPSVYSPASHRAVMRAWTGHEGIHHALPFGYSPTMVWLLGPLALLPDLPAYLAWTALSVAAALWMVRGLETAPFLAGVAVFLSPLALWSFGLGQTAVLSTAGMLFLARHANDPVPGWRGAILPAVVLWALTAKPPLALTAGAALLACRGWRAVVVALAITLTSTIVVSPLLGPGWVRDYLAMVTRYTGDAADPTFAWSLVPAYMSNLRAVLVLYGITPDETASRISSFLWLAALALVFLAALARRWSAPAVWTAAVLALLLVSPHVNSTEDLALFVPFAVWCAAVAPEKGSGRYLPFLFLLPIALTPGKSPPPGLLWPLPAFAAKVFLIALTWRLSGRLAPRR